MRKSNLFFSAAMALSVGLFSSCAEDLVVDNQEKADSDQVRYLNVSISSPTGAGTRATDAENDFLQGTATENYVNRMLFVFYDREGNPTGDVATYTFKNNANDGDDDQGIFNPDGDVAGSKGNVGKIWTSVVPITLKQGQNLPSYVMCFINPVTDAQFLTTSLDDIKKLQRQAVITTQNYFPMSNSTYYGDNPITGEKDVPMTATPIAAVQLASSVEDALKKTAVDIYVERYAARVQLTLAPTAILDNDNSVKGYKLTFVPEYWRPNAIDQNVFAVKRFGLMPAGATEPVYEPSYAELKDNFGTTDDGWWNERLKYRSYWGCSPSYYKNSYPKVSDDITDVQANNAHVDGYPYELHYFNYQQIVDSENGNTGITLQKSVKWDENNGFNSVFYARETTAAAKSWKNANEYNPLATMASAVIVGRYKLATDEGTEVAANTTFYLYGQDGNEWNLYFDDATGVSGIKEAMVKHQNVVFRNVGTVQAPVYNAITDITPFVVEHPSKKVRTQDGVAVVAGRLVALQLTQKAVDDNATLDSNQKLYYYNTDEEKYDEISVANMNKVNSNLLSAGYARKYGQGLCYFSIPIEHLAGAVKNDDGSYDFANCPAGAFGIVRNHAYTIEVQSISGLATALRDVNQPIVPPMNDITYYISARVNILNWRIVPTQSVTL